MAVAHAIPMTLSLAPTMTPAAARRRFGAAVPGFLLCAAIAVMATLLQMAEVALFKRAWLESLVIAILLGTATRTVWTPGRLWTRGIEISAKLVLEIAVVLLGATISAAMILRAGPALLAGILGLVAVSIAGSYGLGRIMGLPWRMATLIACGNSICGNSAIAAVAPVIDAECDDVAAAIAFTAVLGVAVVLGLPVLAIALHMTPRAFGVFAGLTVYAVPQVLAATAPISSLSSQVGALVKLVRVLMLGPVVMTLSVIMSWRASRSATPGVLAGRPMPRGPRLAQLVPWFIIGFLVLVGSRSTDLIPHAWLKPASMLATDLTVVSMAALGLGVDVRILARAGVSVTAVVTLSLIGLGLGALTLIRILGAV